MSFGALPPELIIGILDYVLPDDLVSFVSTCHQVHDYASPFLAQHRKFRKEYSTVEIQINGIPRILRGFASDPWKCLYVKHLMFQSLSRADTDEMLEEKRSLLRQCASVAGFETLYRIHARIKQEPFGTHDAIFSLSFWMFSNVESVSICPHFPTPEMHPNGAMRFTTDFIDRIVDASPYGKPNSLQKLSKISIGSGRFPTGRRAFDLLKPFLALPALKEIKGFSIQSSRKRLARNLNDLCRVTDLSLKHSAISLDDMLYLLPNLAQLQRFQYSQYPYYISNARNCVMSQDLCKALEVHARNTLESLVFEVHSNHYTSFKHNGVPSLRSFQVLKNLSLSQELFVDEDYQMPILINTLPSSLQDFKITCWSRPPDLDPRKEQRMFWGLPDLQESRLPQLQRVSFVRNNKVEFMVSFIDATGWSKYYEDDASNGLMLSENSSVNWVWDNVRFTLAGYLQWLSFRQRALERKNRERFIAL